MENSYFYEALSGFTKDFAYGGAIRHLVDRGYTVERMVMDYKKAKGQKAATDERPNPPLR